MPKVDTKKRAEVLALQAAIMLVAEPEEALDEWLRGNQTKRERKEMLRQLVLVAKASRHNLHVADDSLAEQKRLRARDVAGYEAERTRILDQTRKLEDDWNKLTDKCEHQTRQIEALLQVVNCQSEVQYANVALATAMITATGLGIAVKSSG